MWGKTIEEPLRTGNNQTLERLKRSVEQELGGVEGLLVAFQATLDSTQSLSSVNSACVLVASGFVTSGLWRLLQ